MPRLAGLSPDETFSGVGFSGGFGVVDLDDHGEIDSRNPGAAIWRAALGSHFGDHFMTANVKDGPRQAGKASF